MGFCIIYKDPRARDGKTFQIAQNLQYSINYTVNKRGAHTHARALLTSSSGAGGVDRSRN